MLEYTGAGDGTRVAMLVLHDDAKGDAGGGGTVSRVEHSVKSDSQIALKHPAVVWGRTERRPMYAARQDDT